MAGLVFSPVHPLSVHWCRCLTLVFILLCFHGSAGQTQTAPRAPFLLLFLPASSKTTQTHQRNLPDVWGFSRWVNLQDHGGSNLSETLWPVYSLNENMSFPYFLSGFGNRYFVQRWEANHFGSRWLSVVCLYYGSQWDPKRFAIKLYHFIISSKAIYSTHWKKTVFF